MTGRWRFISDHRDLFGVQRLCRALGVSASGFYRWDRRCGDPGRAQGGRRGPGRADRGDPRRVERCLRRPEDHPGAAGTARCGESQTSRAPDA